MSLLHPLWVRVPRSSRTVATIDHESEAPPDTVGLERADIEAIWKALKGLYRSQAYPGIAFCLRHRGQIVMNRTLGHARGNGPRDPRETPKVLLTPQTPICLFSASKAVTAILIHKLAEEGGIDLDQHVRHYLPQFARAGKSSITVADVLAHRGGFPTIRVPKAERRVELLADWDGIVELICKAPPAHGRRMAYHAITGGFILAEILQRVTGGTVAQYLDSRIRQPLGMQFFTYGLASEHREAAALNYTAGTAVRFPISAVAERALLAPFDDVVDASNTPTFLEAVIPAGNIYATAEETSRFFQMLLDGGEWQGRRLLKSETVARAIRPVGRISVDRTLVIPMRYSEGMMLGVNPAGLYGPMTHEAFGHLGFMNILGWADPKRNLSAGLLTTGKAILGTHLVALSRFLSAVGKLGS